MKTLLDAFFWRDPLTGKRRPRLIFWGTMLALVAVLIAVVASLWFIHNYSAALPPTPTPLPPTNTPLPLPTFTPSPVPTATPVPATEKEKMLAEIRGCDPDPANWELVPLFGNWKRLTTPCALTALSRAVAWHIATRAMGYTADEAAQALGYPEGTWPWAPGRAGWAMFATTARVGYAPLEIDFLPDLRQWKVVNAQGELGNLVLTPRGCFRANSDEGRIVWWREKGFPFELECFFHEDLLSKRSVYDLGDGLVGDEPDTPTRYSVLFAYSQELGWVYLGRIHDEKFQWSVEEWEKDHNGRTITQDEQTYAKNWGIPLWDVNWVQEAWEMPIKPLPTEWRWEMGKGTAFQKSFQEMVQYWLDWITENGPYAVEPPQ